jgi:hypothetical protein
MQQSKWKNLASAMLRFFSDAFANAKPRPAWVEKAVSY